MLLNSTPEVEQKFKYFKIYYTVIITVLKYI